MTDLKVDRQRSLQFSKVQIVLLLGSAVISFMLGSLASLYMEDLLGFELDLMAILVAVLFMAVACRYILKMPKVRKIKCWKCNWSLKVSVTPR